MPHTTIYYIFIFIFTGKYFNQLNQRIPSFLWVAMSLQNHGQGAKSVLLVSFLSNEHKAGVIWEEEPQLRKWCHQIDL